MAISFIGRGSLLDKGGRELWCFNNNVSVISWLSALLVEETGVPKENHQPVKGH